MNHHHDPHMPESPAIPTEPRVLCTICHRPLTRVGATLVDPTGGDICMNDDGVDGPHMPEPQTLDEVIASDHQGLLDPPRVLTLSDAFKIAIIGEAASQGKRVVWTPDEGETIFKGTARSLGNENFGFAHSEDIRDLYLRVTGDSGREFALAVTDLMAWMVDGAVSFQER